MLNRDSLMVDIKKKRLPRSTRDDEFLLSSCGFSSPATVRPSLFLSLLRNEVTKQSQSPRLPRTLRVLAMKEGALSLRIESRICNNAWKASTVFLELNPEEPGKRMLSIMRPLHNKRLHRSQRACEI